jgi:hypothetical protein
MWENDPQHLTDHSELTRSLRPASLEVCASLRSAGPAHPASPSAPMACYLLIPVAWARTGPLSPSTAVPCDGTTTVSPAGTQCAGAGQFMWSFRDRDSDPSGQWSVRRESRAGQVSSRP